MAFLSKTKYLNGLQCRKLIWYLYNAKDKVPAYGAATQAIFDQGHEIGRLAKSLFPGGLEIEGKPWDYHGLLARTGQALRKKIPLYEAAFGYGDAFARTDILNPAGDGAWDLIEVKSSTEVKKVNIDDLALQKYVVEGSGLHVRKCILMHINSAYVRAGAVEVEKLFTQEDVTPKVLEKSACVELNLAKLVKGIRQKKVPDIKIGSRCDDPYACILKEICWAFLPENSPLTLSGFNKEKAFKLIHRGILNITDVPGTVALNEKQTIQLEAARTGCRHIDPGAIRAFLKTLVYPISFLDFETFMTAIPLYDGIRPYQQVPFQFSLHIVEAAGAGLSHHSYLSDGRKDPSRKILDLLMERLGDSGSIVCYNAAFERGVLNRAVEAYPEYQKWWMAAQTRLVDLLGPFRAFAFYHPEQSGSASLKAVLPALTGEGYDSLDIADGETASREYLRVTFGEADEEERARVRGQLEDYCGLDTLGMIRIVEALKSI
jgi:hypothetical protein